MAVLLSEPILPVSSRWLLVWSLGLVNECACPRRYSCANPGKHPWHGGYEHGALSATAEKPVDFPISLRLAAVPGPEVMVIDLDSDRAWWSMVRRLSGEISGDELIGAAKTPRGWHIYVRSVGGWEQREVRAYMSRYFPWWKDSGLDIRTGSRSYLVWPGGEPYRYWVPVEDFAERVVQDWRDCGDSPGTAAFPWQLPEHAAAEWQWRWRQTYKPAATGTRLVIPKGRAEAALTKRCEQLRDMSEGRRNNFLNQIAFYEGATAVKAGADPAKVRELLVEAGVAAGLTPAECKATIRSGLTAGGV